MLFRISLIAPLAFTTALLVRAAPHYNAQDVHGQRIFPSVGSNVMEYYEDEGVSLHRRSGTGAKVEGLNVNDKRPHGYQSQPYFASNPRLVRIDQQVIKEKSAELAATQAQTESKHQDMIKNGQYYFQ